MRRPGLAVMLFCLLGVGSAIPALVVGWLQSNRQVSAAIEREEQAAALAAHALAREANSFLRANFHAVRALAAQVQAVGLNPVDLVPLLQVSRRQFPGVYLCYALDPSGKSIATDPAVDVYGALTVGRDYSDRTYVREVMTTHRPASSEPLKGKSNAKPSVIMVAPVLDRHGGLSAIVGCGLELDALQELVDGTLSVHSDLRGVIVDAKQRVVAHPDPEMRESIAALGEHSIYAPVPPHTQVVRTGVDETGTSVRVVASAVDELGWVAIVSQPEARLSGIAASIRTGVLTTTLIALVLCLMAAGALARWLTAPISRLRRIAREIGHGNLAARVPAAGRSDAREVADLMEAIDEMAVRLRDHAHELQGVTGALAAAVTSMTTLGARSRKGADESLRGVERALGSTRRVVESVRSIGRNIGVLADSEKLSTTAIGRLAKTQTDAEHSVRMMLQSVDGTRAALEGMLASFRAVAGKIDQTSTTAQVTVASMQEMDAAIGDVRSIARETSALSRQVQSAADEGAVVLAQTLQGIERIRASSHGAAGTLKELEERMQDIGGVVDVIDTVAHQTRLLAFNAAIIAGEAGAHGAGFAVVAEEIRRLAERTNDATGRIGDIIGGLRKGAQQVIGAVQGGLGHVEAGVRLGQQAEEALRTIVSRSVRATEMAESIANASEQQARRSSHVTSGMDRIASTMRELATATESHVRSSNELQDRMQQMHAAASGVRKATDDQAHGSMELTQAMQRVQETVRELTQTQTAQSRSADEILAEVDRIRLHAERQSQAVRELEETIHSLVRQAEIVRREVERFTV